jgi:hypothetical protein
LLEPNTIDYPYTACNSSCCERATKSFDATPSETPIMSRSSKIAKLDIPRMFLWCLVFFFFTRPVDALDTSRQISQYGHTAWRIEDGVFAGAPNAMAQTTDGYLWIGTQSGLMRFDGVRFVSWRPPEGNELPSSRINSLLGSAGWKPVDRNRCGLSSLAEWKSDQLQGRGWKYHGDP